MPFDGNPARQPSSRRRHLARAGIRHSTYDSSSSLIRNPLVFGTHAFSGKERKRNGLQRIRRLAVENR